MRLNCAAWGNVAKSERRSMVILEMQTSAVKQIHYPDTNTCSCEGEDALSECIKIGIY